MNKLGKDLICLAPSLEQPRVIKRIIDKSEHYDNIWIFSFTRKIYRVNNFSKLEEIENVKYRVVGQFENRTFALRFLLYIKLFCLLLLRYGLSRKEVYVFGFDMRFISFFLPNAYTTYEISDIIWLYKSDVIKNMMSRIDFLFAQRSSKVVFTSTAFYKEHYAFLNEEKVLIAENKFKSYGIVSSIDKILTDKIRIAYIGAFRYPTIVDILITTCIQYKDKVELRFYGDSHTNIIDKIKKETSVNDNIHYFGPFTNPDDLEDIYSQNNINFVAYDNSKANEKVAMPNKFYESGFFNIPIVCSTGTFVGKRVEELNMGWVIDPTKSGIENFIKDITIKDIINTHNKIKSIDKSLFEHE